MSSSVATQSSCRWKGTDMNKQSWRIRLLIFIAIKLCKSQYTVNYTPPENDEMVGIAFAWNVETAQKMVARFSEIPMPQTLTRKQRRALNAAAKRAAKS